MTQAKTFDIESQVDILALMQSPSLFGARPKLVNVPKDIDWNTILLTAALFREGRYKDASEVQIFELALQRSTLEREQLFQNSAGLGSRMDKLMDNNTIPEAFLRCAKHLLEKIETKAKTLSVSA